MNIKKFVLYILGLSLIFIPIWQLQRFNEMKRELYFAEQKNESFQKDLILKEKLQGNYIWELLNENEDEFFKFLHEIKLQNSFIFLFVDTISCYSCFKFHINSLKRFDNIKIVVASRNHFKLIKKYLNSPIEYNLKIYKIMHYYNFLICLVEATGKIIYADSADQTNYYKSEIFYNVLKNYFKK